MKLLIKNCLIADHSSPHNLQRKNIFVVDGTIHLITNDTVNDADVVIEGNDIVATQGWVDCFSFLGEPGYEFRETLSSGAAAASAGGFNHVFCLPNTLPICDQKTQAEFISSYTNAATAKLYPIGAVSKKNEGKELAEMYDLKSGGAIAFSDGLRPIQSAVLMLKALQYVEACNGIIIQLPVDDAFNRIGLMNEGIVSTQMGMPGQPAIAEELMIKRDITLLRYTGSRLHITGISTQAGIDAIRSAKAEGLNISCSVTPAHLFFCDEDVTNYDTNMKVSPPLRTAADRDALRLALLDGTIDCIASHHLPQAIDAKQCEFEAAGYGMISAQTAFAATHHSIHHLTPSNIAELFSTNARKIFGLPQQIIAEGATADITVFSMNDDFIFTPENNLSRSANSPFFGQRFTGKVIAAIHKTKLSLAPN